MSATDPADLQVHARAQLGLSRQLEQTRRVAPHPCIGGRGYDAWFRKEQLAKAQAGEVVDVSESSLRRWRERLHPYRQTGNKSREQVVGVGLINLVTFLRAWPEATLDEMAVFLYNEGGPLYSKQVLSKRLAELEITKKRASTEAYQAQREDVQFRVWSFFNCPSPLGIFQVPRRKLIDVDEFGITMEKCNRTGGWALRVFRVQNKGHYHFGAKITVIFAIEPGDPRLPPHVLGSVQRPRRWIRCVHGCGTTTNIFRDFCDHVCTEIEQYGVQGTDDHRIFIWDNLAAHHSAYVHQTVTGRDGPCRFSIVARPQYHPKFGPIEYKICELTNIHRMRKQPNWTMQTLENKIYAAATSIETFDSTFVHCGYRWV
jgi:hypothetical protein